MKTLLTVVLVCAGMLFIAGAGVAWSQSDYVCYDAYQLCGTYGGQCYPNQAYCAISQGGYYYYVNASSLILGQCVANPGSTCGNAKGTCSYTFWIGTNCSSGLCGTNSTQYSGCNTLN